MSIGLGKEIPDAIYKYIDTFSAGMMADTEAADANFDQCLWALHPGSELGAAEGGGERGLCARTGPLLIRSRRSVCCVVASVFRSVAP